MNEHIHAFFDKDHKRFIAWSFVLIAFSLSIAILENIPVPQTDSSATTAGVLLAGETYEGEIDVLILDDFNAAVKVDRYEYYLRSANGKTGTKLNVHAIAKDRLAELVTGDKVRIQGRVGLTRAIEASTIEVIAPAEQVPTSESATSTTETTDEAVVVSDERRAVTLLINFADKNQGGTVGNVSSMMYTGAQNVDNLYRTSSRGQVGFNPDTDGNGTPDVFGPFTIPSTTSTSSCNYYQWAYEAEDAATKAGIDLSIYQHRMFVIPSNPGGCGWYGVANVGCGAFCRSWGYGATDVMLWAHELGHNLGMSHAGTDPGNDGTIDSAYGDTSDPMGSNSSFRIFAGPNYIKNGWASTFPSSVVDVFTGGDFTLSPLTADPAITQYPQVLRIFKKDTSEYYYVSFRKAEGYDAALGVKYTDGVSIHRSSRTLGGVTALVKNLSATATTWADQINGITIIQTGRATDGSSVNIHIEQAVACTSLQPTVTINPSPQSSNTPGIFTFVVDVFNNDSGCSNTTYTPTLSETALVGTFSPVSAVVSSEMNARYTLTLTVPDGGSWPFSVTVKDIDGTAPSHTDVVISSRVVIDTQAPTTPVLKGTITKQGSVSLAWTASSDDGGVTGYDVLRDGILLTTVTGTSYIEKPVAGAYSYTVRARDGAQNLSTPSNAIQLVTAKTTGSKGRR